MPFTSSNVSLLGWKVLSDFAGSTSASDCWGYTAPSGREYALIGLSNGTGFVEVTDPGAPAIVDFESGVNSLWRGIKTYSNYAYVVSEGGGGIQVFDLSQIDSGSVTLANTITTGGCSQATHTLAVDEDAGFLYRAGGSFTPCAGGPQGLVIYSLANPGSPSVAGEWHVRYVHECQVVTWDLAGSYFGKQIAFCYTENSAGGGDPRLHILDVTNKASIKELSSTSYTGGQFSHQGWISADKLQLYLNDELDDDSFGASRTRIFSIRDLAAPTYLGYFSSGAGSIDHNLYVNENRIYEGNYRSGLRVFDNTTRNFPRQIGFFDTYPEDDVAEFNGLWSNYPYFASGTIIGGDIEKGLFVWRVGAPRLTFDFPSGLPEFLAPTGSSVQFEVLQKVPGDLEAGSVELHFGTGGSFTSVGATPLGGDLYQASLPAIPCGSEVEFYVSGKSADDTTWTDPPAGSTQVHIATAAVGEALAFEETFEINSGWLVGAAGDTATTGIWTRVNPIGTSAQPEDDHTGPPGVFCFVTGQGSPGGGLGENDVDGGVTTLRSPPFDPTALNNPYLVYWRWYSENQGSFVDDTFLIDISNDGGATWVSLEVLGPTGSDAVGGWIQHRSRIADFVTPTNNMRLRFQARDTGSGSITEAAIDDLRIVDLDCGLPRSAGDQAPRTR